MPTSAQEIVNLVLANTLVAGLEDLEGVIIGAPEPEPADRDKLWVRQDSGSGRVIGVYTYSGGWIQVPVKVPTGEVEPAAPQTGELFFNTKTGTLKLYNGTSWSSNLTPSGATSDRPTPVPVGYLFYDTDISRLLRYTSSGWSTYDGFIGEIRMTDSLTDDEVKARNPGWEVYTALAGRFPIGKTDDISAGEDGGRSAIDWSTDAYAAQGGSRDSGVITKISIDGVAGTSVPNTTKTSTGSFDITNPYHGVTFIKKFY
jgi:hypothetical protein